MPKSGGSAPVTGAGGHTVSAHGRRAWLLRTIRVRLLLPIAVATAGLSVLGALQFRDAAGSAREGEYARVLARGLTATVKLNHQLEQEVAETSSLLLRNGEGRQLLTAQQARTDAAVSDYLRDAGRVAAQTPAISASISHTFGELAKLPLMRDLAQQPEKAGQSGALISYPSADDHVGGGPGAAFNHITHILVDMAEAIAVQPVDSRLAVNSQIVAVLSAAEHRAAEQRSLLREVFRRGSFRPGELGELAELRGSEQDRIAQFAAIAGQSVRDRYAMLVRGPDVEKAREMAESALRFETQPNALKVDPDGWYIAQTNAMRRLHLFELDVITMLETDAAVLEATARNQQLATGAGAGAVVLLTLAAAISLAADTSKRLRRLRRGAALVTNMELPQAISAVSAAPSPQTVKEVTSASHERVASWLDRDGDEIGELGAALDGLHRQALRLASDQALLRMDVARIFVALSRRGQTLVQRQLQLLDEFERVETDPDTLGRLFQLDHLAARMRRNEENLLVLAGGEPGRAFVEHELLGDVVMAAAAEIEQYARIDASSVAEVWVDATAVGDLVHLLAELLENAVIFSPPETKVQVSSHRTVDDLTITIYDHGIGIPPEQLDEINQQLSRPSALTGELASRMGLLVVGRLAQRLKIAVELRSAPSSGTVALVRLPSRLLPPAHLITRRRPADSPVWAPEIPRPFTGVGRAAAAVNGPAPVLPGAIPARGRATVAPAIPIPAEPLPTAASITGVIDPDLARARLSSLASGLAAAQRQAPPPV
ncbi:MAG: sensor histidine kinase [Hamadaea sp.]|nr:sensor histidine kinase [Hamadaea sp.]